MAITILEQKKRQQYLIIILAVVISAIILVVWQGFLSEKVVAPDQVLLPKKTVKINFEVLKDPQLEKLKPLEELPVFQGKPGRENPFSPY